MLYIGFNGTSSTGLSQDDMELSLKTKWLIIDPSYYPANTEGKFFFKLTEWTDREHTRFTYGLVSGAKKYIMSTSDRTTLASIMND